MNDAQSYACGHSSTCGPMLRAIAAGILIVTATSCTNWKPVTVEPTAYIGAKHPEALWVQLQDGSTFLLARPTVFRDTLRGVDAGSYRNIPLSKIAGLRAQEPAKGKTAALAVLGVAAVVGIIVLGATSDNTY